MCAYNIDMNTTQEQLLEEIEALVATADAGLRSCDPEDEVTENAWERLYLAEENCYKDIMDGGYGDVEYESEEFLRIVIRRIVDLADELGLAI